MFHQISIYGPVWNGEQAPFRQPFHLYAPGRTFDHNRPEGCMALCLGSCTSERPCPFLGCAADAAGFAPHSHEPAQSAVTLH